MSAKAVLCKLLLPTQTAPCLGRPQPAAVTRSRQHAAAGVGRGSWISGTAGLQGGPAAGWAARSRVSLQFQRARWGWHRMQAKTWAGLACTRAHEVKGSITRKGKCLAWRAVSQHPQCRAAKPQEEIATQTGRGSTRVREARKKPRQNVCTCAGGGWGGAGPEGARPPSLRCVQHMA